LELVALLKVLMQDLVLEDLVEEAILVALVMVVKVVGSLEYFLDLFHKQTL
jgi:hypothetical protein